MSAKIHVATDGWHQKDLIKD